MLLSDDQPFPILLPVPDDLWPLISSSHLKFRAHFQTGGVVFSRHSTHIGNSLILFYPQDCRDATPGCIKYIYEDNGSIWFAVQRHLPAPKGTVDPYRHYPYFPAQLYLTSLSTIKLIPPSRVLSHVARWQFSEELVVILALTMD
ncbi:hypothetical protein JVU11DRAFT_11990 [Chiua virens]|nr:hypothetical protein JVU11DRAFT_11990 [Chiua virens]